MKVLICIPYTGYVAPQAAYSLIPMACHARNKGVSVDMLPIGLSLVYTAREEAAKALLQGEYDSLLFVDSDMVVPPDLLIRLIEADKDIVSALAFRRTPGYEPCIFKECSETDAKFYLDYPKGLIEVEGVGMACTLIKRKVFETVPGPWFFPHKTLGEDLSFCVRARKAGFKIFCDTELIVGHCNVETITEAHYEKWRAING
jgi:GT2 family glycosyltransferase